MKKKSRLIVSLLTAFIMAFTVFPYMGAGNVSAETDPYVYVNQEWDDSSLLNEGLLDLVKQITYVPQSDGTFNALVTVSTIHFNQVGDPRDLPTDGALKIKWTVNGASDSYIDMFDTGYFNESNYTIKGIIPGSNWQLKAEIWDGSSLAGGYTYPQHQCTAPKLKPEHCSHKWDSGTVTKAATCKEAGVKTYKCTICDTTKTEPIDKLTTHSYSGGKCTECGADYVYKYNFKTLTATATENNNNEPVVEIECGEFDSPDGFYNFNGTNQLAVFRESNGKIRKLAMKCYKEFTDNIKIDYGTKYTYYIVDLGYVTGEAKDILNNVGNKDEDLTDNIKNALTDSHVTKSEPVTTKKYPVVPVKDVKVWSKGVRWVELGWTRGTGYVDGYVLKSYDVNGKLRETKTVGKLGYGGTKIYVAYSGKSKVTIQPYAKYTKYDGTTVTAYGTKVTASGLTSKAMTPAGGNVTKITTSKTRIIANKTTGAKGIQIQYKIPYKSWKYVTTGTTSSKYKKTLSVKNAGKATYRYRTYLVDKNGKKYYSSWKEYKPKTNQAVYSASSWSYYRNKDLKNISVPYRTHWEPRKVYYSKANSQGYIKVKGAYYNTSNYVTRTCKVKVTFYTDTGSKIATKTISSKVKPHAIKTQTFTLSSKDYVNLRNITYKISYSRR